MKKTNNLVSFIARTILVIVLVVVSNLFLSSCQDEPQLVNKVNAEGEGKEPTTPQDPTLVDVEGFECKLVKSNDTQAFAENGVTTISKSYNYSKTFELVYSDDSNSKKVEEYTVEHSFVINGLSAVFSVDNIDEIAGKTFTVAGNKAEIAGREVSVTASKKGSRSVEFSNGRIRWNFAVDQNYSVENNGQLIKDELCSNVIIGKTISFGAAEKVEGSDNTYNLTGTFTAEVSDGDNIIYSFPAVATTSEKDEVYYTIENIRQQGNTILFDGLEGHTLHPELNKREALEKMFDASLRAGETIRYNDLNSVSAANANGNVFSYVQGKVTLVATYPSEVVVEYNGVKQTVSIPAPAFAEVKRNETKSEDEDYNYLTTEITYEMGWNGTVVDSAVQTFIGRTEKEKDAVSRIYLDYTENNGEISGKLIEEHTLAEDKVLLTFSGSREFGVTAEETITIEAAKNELTRTDHKNGAWVKVGNYVGNNIKGDKMTVTFVHTYNGNVKNNVVISMNRNLYVEYAGKKYEIADKTAVLTGANPAAAGNSDNSTYFLYNYNVVYTATAGDLKATATQAFVVKVRKPEHTISGYEVDEAYANRFAVTYSWNSATSAYETFNGIVFRNINDHSQKKLVVFRSGETTPFVQQDASQAEVDAFFANRGDDVYVSTNYSEVEKGKVSALVGYLTKGDYKNGFSYLPFAGSARHFTKEAINVKNLPNPFRGTITMDANGLWGGLYF